MTSILSNFGATVALQNLKATNSNMQAVQSQISSGFSVGDAKTNAAIWSVSKIMQSDVEGFKSIRDTLNLGESTIAVARQAAESIVERLTTIKKHIVSSQTSNVDLEKIQVSIDAEKDQIKNTIKTAQFNGMNLINGTAGDEVSFLSSLDRDNTGNVTASHITHTTTNFRVDGTGGTVDAFDSDTKSATSAILSSDETEATFTFDYDTTTAEAGDKFTLTIGDKKVEYTITENDLKTAANTDSDVNAILLSNIKRGIDALGIADLTVSFDLTNTTLNFEYAGDEPLAITAKATNGEGVGILADLDGVDVTSNAATALTNIDKMITAAVKAAAELGATEAQIVSQAKFVGQLTDSLKAGVSSLVEADMEEASARLQALQTQQQLGIQALSIANQAPQALLKLFQ